MTSLTPLKFSREFVETYKPGELSDDSEAMYDAVPAYGAGCYDTACGRFRIRKVNRGCWRIMTCGAGWFERKDALDEYGLYRARFTSRGAAVEALSELCEAETL